MESKSLDVFIEASNYGIVRMPGRRFPGCVIQGDSLANLLSAAAVILRESRSVKNRLLAEAARELYDALSDRLDHHEAVLEEHGIELPYERRPGV
jgi:hypothetical protein